ncbi:MAG: hypothetical protein IPF99_36930 [Deltaproteobacteria bacterium]|nr:hypothetical protein [Deltaproteobacteria bacterium]
MNIRKTSALVTLGLCALVGVVAYRVGRARADGVPTASPLYYGGVLDDGGRPVEGMRNVTIRLWDMASGGTAACTTVAPNTAFSGGRFRIELDAACTGAVRSNPNLWAEVLVDSTTFARTKLGAVPYALEAGRAAGASGPLEARIAAVEALAQPRQVEVSSGSGMVTIGGQAAPAMSNAAIPGTTFTFTPRATSVFSITSQCVVTGVARISVVVVSTPGPTNFVSIQVPVDTTDRNGSSSSLGTQTVPIQATGTFQSSVPYTIQFTGELSAGSYVQTIVRCSRIVVTQLN